MTANDTNLTPRQAKTIRMESLYRRASAAYFRRTEAGQNADTAKRKMEAAMDFLGFEY